MTEKERSLAMSTRPRSSRAIRNSKSVAAAAIQARGYQSKVVIHPQFPEHVRNSDVKICVRK